MKILRRIPFFGSLSPDWSFRPRGVLWRIVPSGDGYIFGESRDQEQKRVTFFCVGMRDGAAAWEGVSVEEPWWVGIEAVHDRLIFLHLYARPDMPGHAGIIALDRSNGHKIWERSDLQFQRCIGPHVIANDPHSDGRADIVLASSTGQQVEISAAHEREIPENEGHATVAYPELIQEGDSGWDMFRRILSDDHLVGMCEGAQVDGRWIFSYHASSPSPKEPRGFEHRLAIVDGNGRKLFEDVLHSQAHMPVYDAFFLWNGCLAYVREERELVGIVVGHRTEDQ